jgi:hypothetical protein
MFYINSATGNKKMTKSAKILNAMLKECESEHEKQWAAARADQNMMIRYKEELKVKHVRRGKSVFSY